MRVTETMGDCPNLQVILCSFSVRSTLSRWIWPHLRPRQPPEQDRPPGRAAAWLLVALRLRIAGGLRREGLPGGAAGAFHSLAQSLREALELRDEPELAPLTYA